VGGVTSSSRAGERVSAVIVHYRTPGETVRSAAAVAATAPAAEIVVVDNASRDAVATALAARVPAARVLVEDSNRGYGAGCNRGARETSRPYLLFLNSDAVVQPGAVAALEAALDGNRRAAAAGPRLSNADGSLQPSIRRFPTPWRIFCESAGLALVSGGRRPLEGHTATRQDHERAREVEALMGAALLVRREAYDDAGGFDEAFFLYAEETDLMVRWAARKWTLLYEPSARVLHEGGRSGGDALFGQLHASLVRYTAKHHGRGAARFARLALDGGAALRYAAALVTPGARGRARRARYRAALERREGPSAVPAR
jgi:N-acetylglucosaminyl-diphospho-decaprenol L-rhamnosyltransferase